MTASHTFLHPDSNSQNYLLLVTKHRHLKLMCPAWSAYVISPDLFTCMYILLQWITRLFTQSPKAESWWPFPTLCPSSSALAVVQEPNPTVWLPLYALSWCCFESFCFLACMFYRACSLTWAIHLPHMAAAQSCKNASTLIPYLISLNVFSFPSG